MDALNLLLRWLHVVAGVIWIGHLYFFNFVNAQVAKTYDADSKKKVVPELMPRALYWFRWGAMYTWVSGILLFWIVFPMGGNMTAEGGPLPPHATGGVVILFWLVAFFVYDALWKSPLGKNELAGGVVSYLLVVGVAFGLSFLVSSRAVWIGVAGMFGTIMMMNVWMRIWPSQRKIITGIAGKGPAADASVPALAALRSKHNTFMSVPLILFMMNLHYPTAAIGPINLGYGSAMAFLPIAVFVALGWGTVKLLYNKSGTEAPKYYGASDGGGGSQAKAG